MRGAQIILRFVALGVALAVLHCHASDSFSAGDHAANVNGITVGYKVAGHGPILVVQSPGWGITSTYLQRTLVPLERNFTLIYVDSRGSGKSSRPTDPSKMSTLDMADDLEALRQFLGLPKIDVFGHSHGGEIAAAFAAKNPTHVNHLILVDSSLPKNPDPDNDAKYTELNDRLIKDPRFTDAVKAVRDPTVPDTSEGIGSMLQRMTPLYWHDTSKASALKDLPPVDAWAGAALGKADGQLNFDLFPELGHLTAPTLILQGQEDYVVPAFFQESFAKSIPHSRLVIFEQSGHFPWIEEPDRFFSLVSSFLDGH